ncbi:MarR family transcriptional regulator [Sphingobium sp. SYK-6]|nr:MarR family transcriptional regulator [Sphingobium sp. SYK-6]
MGERMRQDDQDAGTGSTDAPAALLPSPLDNMLGYRIRRASMAMMHDLAHALRPFDISVGEASLLIMVGANPGCRQSDLGRALEIKRANMTPLVGRLKARGLITDAPIDGRSLSLTLTEEGEALQKVLLAHAQTSNDRFRKRLALDEKDLIAAMAALAR